MRGRSVSGKAATATTPAALLTKVAQRLRELILRQRLCDLQQVVEQWHQAVIRAALAAQRVRLVRNSFVDHAFGKHRIAILWRSPEDEGPESQVVARLAAAPHRLHGLIDLAVRLEQLVHAGLEGRDVTGDRGGEDVLGGGDGLARERDHGDVDADEASFGPVRILEGADEVQVGEGVAACFAVAGGEGGVAESEVTGVETSALPPVRARKKPSHSLVVDQSVCERSVVGVECQSTREMVLHPRPPRRPPSIPALCYSQLEAYSMNGKWPRKSASFFNGTAICAGSTSLPGAYSPVFLNDTSVGSNK